MNENEELSWMHFGTHILECIGKALIPYAGCYANIKLGEDQVGTNTYLGVSNGCKATSSVSETPGGAFWLL